MPVEVSRGFQRLVESPLAIDVYTCQLDARIFGQKGLEIVKRKSFIFVAF
jgi:hypothetical protein